MNASDLSAYDRAICGEIWASDAAARNLGCLCQECNGRFAGSDDYRRAAEMVADWWREIGLRDVRLEPFPFTAWERGSALLSLTWPEARSYPCLALPYAPACDLEAEAIDLGFGLEADISRAGGNDPGQDRPGEERRASRRSVGTSAPEVCPRESGRGRGVPLRGRPARHVTTHRQPGLHPGWAARSGVAERRHPLRSRSGPGPLG